MTDLLLRVSVHVIGPAELEVVLVLDLHRVLMVSIQQGGESTAGSRDERHYYIHKEVSNINLRSSAVVCTL